MSADEQAITVRLPVALYEQLRREAFDSRRSQAAIIREALAKRYEQAAVSMTPAEFETFTRKHGVRWEPQ